LYEEQEYAIFISNLLESLDLDKFALDNKVFIKYLLDNKQK